MDQNEVPAFGVCSGLKGQNHSQYKTHSVLIGNLLPQQNTNKVAAVPQPEWSQTCPPLDTNLLTFLLVLYINYQLLQNKIK